MYIFSYTIAAIVKTRSRRSFYSVLKYRNPDSGDCKRLKSIHTVFLSAVTSSARIIISRIITHATGTKQAIPSSYNT